ncbi:MAG: response regulator, partial [Bacteroidota bacterium]
NHLTYDQSGTLWIATEAGLCKSESGVVTCYTSSDGLVSNQCRSLLVDDSGYVWVGTPKGTSRFDGQSFISFNTSNGLLCNDVNALFQDSKKRLWVGGSKGISVLNLYPELKLKKAPVLELTKFALNGKTGRFHPYSTFQHASSLTFGFSALKSLGSKDAVMIQYQLNDGPWQDTDRRSFEFYSLSQGDYKLTLRAKGMETAWSAPMTLAFDIAPPGWLSLPAFIAYLAAVMLLMLGIMKYEKRKLKLKAELRKKSLEATQLKELDTLKSRFFSNISHEFRTPLALIIGLLEQLFESDLKATHQKKLHMVHRNATGLLELINQLLDLSRMEADQLKRNIETRELVADIREFAESFLMLADSTNKHFEVNYEIRHLEMRYDYHEIRKIIYNLLYNAFKFTPPDSVIRLSVAVDPVGATGKGSVLLVVEDTGMGIQKENIDKIFTPFFQEEHAPADHLGSGLGLALVKELVALNEGSIQVSSQMGQGTTFVVQLPIKVEEKGQVANGSNVPVSEEEATWDDQDIQEKRSVILLVEDHRDMRQFICEVLAGSYQLITARDATEGLVQAQERIPDLIISDVMMPGTDGFQFCKQLKTTESTSHIPVVLLTAKAGMVNKLEGLETGADDYLTKPFSQKELRVRISNLIRQRQVLRKKFSSDPDMSLSDVALNSVDEQFLHRVVGVINEHLTNFDFDIELLARETGLSRGHLHKKIKALTGLTPSEFNRKVRLKHAASLLKKPVGNVSEICYRVGFNSHSYFSKCFLQQYGQTPSDFMAQHGAGVSMA